MVRRCSAAGDTRRERCLTPRKVRCAGVRHPIWDLTCFLTGLPLAQQASLAARLSGSALPELRAPSMVPVGEVARPAALIDAAQKDAAPRPGVTARRGEARQRGAASSLTRKPYQFDCRSAVALTRWMLRSAPSNSSSWPRRKPTVIRSSP